MPADRHCLPGLLAASLPRQGTKHLLVFTAPPFAFLFGADVWLPDCGAQVVFCLTSCATHLFNGCLEMAADRAHPSKRYRAIAADLVILLAPAAFTTAAEPLMEFLVGEPGIKLTLAVRLSTRTVIGLPSWAG